MSSAPWLADPAATIEILQKYDFHFHKRFGQNFLIDTHVLDKIIGAAEITKDDFVIEVGPGIGTLTQYLAANGGKVLAVEIDSSLLPILEETLAEWDNVKVLHGDILQTDLRRIIAEESGGAPVKVVANLPYYITTPILMGLLEQEIPLTSITVMVQKEVAMRMQAAPGSKDYGALSLAVQYYAEPYLAANVPPNCFMPRPQVGSAVIRLTVIPGGRFAVTDKELMFRLIRASFAQRRKTLVNGLRGDPELQLDRQAAEELLQACGHPVNIRGEALRLEDFAALAEAYLKKTGNQ